MKTKRRAWVVAGVVVLLAAGISIPLWGDIWLTVAYEHKQGGDYRYLKKRAGWLPGPYLQAVQPCPACHTHNHSECRGRSIPSVNYPVRNEYIGGLVVVFFPEGSLTISDFVCTCPDPSHK